MIDLDAIVLGKKDVLVKKQFEKLTAKSQTSIALHDAKPLLDLAEGPKKSFHHINRLDCLPTLV